MRVVERMLVNGRLAQHVATVQCILGRRAHAMVGALHRHAAGLVSFVVPEGGYFVWVELLHGLLADVVLERCLADPVMTTSGMSMAPLRLHSRAGVILR